MDLYYFKVNFAEYKIDKNNAYTPIVIAGRKHTLEDAEKVHENLGLMIETVKRMSNENTPVT